MLSSLGKTQHTVLEYMFLIAWTKLILLIPVINYKMPKKDMLDISSGKREKNLG